MTDSQKLLAEYAKNGSEPAFRELVGRYVDLVYSTALRLVGGDTHRAQDVSQTVFVHLARQAHRLPNAVMLGGWLHRDACHVAATTMRGERRRQAREREAVQMNALQDHAQAGLAELAPILDEAIDQLGAEDRTAILLRFFEECDFRAVGQALGSREDAARMRVTRALEKLHVLLKRRGVTFSVAALTSALASEAVTAAPAGLAGTMAATAMAGAAASQAGLTFLETLGLSKLKLGLISALVLAGLATPLALQHRAQAKLRQENQSLREQIDQLAGLAAEHERLSNLVAQARNLQPASTPPSAELLKLRNQAGLLHVAERDNARLKAEQDTLVQRLQAAEPAAAETISNREQRVLSVKTDFAQALGQSVQIYGAHHQRQLTTIAEAVSYALLEDEIRAAAESNGFGPEQFELVAKELPPVSEPPVLMLREKQPCRQSDGTWVRVYVDTACGVQTPTSTNGDFTAWEQPRWPSHTAP